MSDDDDDDGGVFVFGFRNTNTTMASAIRTAMPRLPDPSKRGNLLPI